MLVTVTFIVFVRKLSMAGFGNLVQKAFYLGVGIASYAGEKAGGAIGELRGQAQKLVDELVERGEITAEEAQKMMNDMVDRAEATAAAGAADSSALSETRRTLGKFKSWMTASR